MIKIDVISVCNFKYQYLVHKAENDAKNQRKVQPSIFPGEDSLTLNISVCAQHPFVSILTFTLFRFIVFPDMDLEHSFGFRQPTTQSAFP
jgi:hypothetical protein